MSHPFHPPWFDLLYIRWNVQVTKLLNMQSSPVSLHLVPLRSKYSPQHPILHPQSMFYAQKQANK
jgi:hypothetical protein